MEINIGASPQGLNLDNGRSFWVFFCFVFSFQTTRSEIVNSKYEKNEVAMSGWGILVDFCTMKFSNIYVLLKQINTATREREINR